MIIFIDQYLLTGFCMNLLLVHITDIIIHSRLTKIKKILFSMIATICSLTIFIPYISTQLHIITNIVVTTIMLTSTFKPNNLIAAFRIIIVYCIVTFSAAGCAYMIICFSFNSAVTVLLPTAVISYLVMSCISDIYEKYYKEDKLCHKLTIYTKETSVDIGGYIDTGNSLKDPVTKLPVIIVGIDSIKSLFPNDFVRRIRSNEDIKEIFSLYAEELLLKLIPFHSIGGDGLLLGYTPEKITIDNIETKGIIAISSDQVLKHKKNTAILHPQIII